mmetsp:Transcript_8444/g.15389  ORF Transcript_8444/g.15389 Transcript_8444/m.15389 type:complete len:247 (+) Transcript_8444:155-895(+)|eukprot:CAMPEP_0202000846 /NCGR_PEP_ID=MMETSP0905-20130828/7108_1 /ASSEMBLY_ACC=CAM_ASM_000554 /TAXON_ID=420261 /ORGANISM="Thalassiosira antarctica, Strain CCMP982" /LENGTH=246 /DNA_ID=CAMNT_0048557431 /DNA_START=80 /DNA_END=820 /DNA_ORIENTATION=+
MKKEISRQIIHLLKKSNSPRVAIAESTITDKNHESAGRGVFSQQKVSSNELPMAMCLYPGIYTRGIPIHAMRSAEYLANRSPPSNYGLDIGENAYIMNLNNCGGYIDGCALESQYGEYDALDINPSACGHLVNHDAARSNVEVISFAWDELITKDETMMSTKEDHFALPNELRADGFPWYYDTALDKLVSFPSRDQKPPPQKMLCGAALILTKPISHGEELLLDYGLGDPLPSWAEGWYNGTTCAR